MMRRFRVGGRNLVLCYLASACTTWRTIPANRLPPTVQQTQFDRVRVVRRDSTLVELRRARISPDSISGYERRRGSRTRLSMPLEEISRIQSHEPDATRTLLLIGAITVALVGLYAWMLEQSGKCRIPAGPNVSCS